VIELQPNSATAYYNRAVIYGDKENFKAALDDYNKVLTLNNKNILAYFNRAITLQQLKRLKDARKDIEKTIELYPDFVDAYKVRASLKQELGDYYGAEQDLQTAAIINESKLNYSDSLKQVEELFIAKVTSFSDGNTNTSSGTSKLNDISLSPAYGLSLIPTQKEKHIIDAWNKTNKSFTSFYLYYLDDREVVLANTQNSVLDGINKQLLKTSTNAELYLKRAIVYTSLNQFDKAILDLNKSISLDPTNYIAYFSRATMIYSIIKSLNETENSNYSLDMVINDYDKCIKENPNFSFAYFNRANLKCQQENYIGAIEDYSEAIKVSSSFSEAYLNRALILLILDNKEQACIDLSKSGELGNTSVYDIIAKYCN
jgi:tetratricopeptide (TPR) repeat protein